MQVAVRVWVGHRLLQEERERSLRCDACGELSAHSRCRLEKVNKKLSKTHAKKGDRVLARFFQGPI